MRRYFGISMIILGVAAFVFFGYRYLKGTDEGYAAVSDDMKETRYRLSADPKRGALIIASAGLLVSIAGSFVFRKKKSS